MEQQQSQQSAPVRHSSRGPWSQGARPSGRRPRWRPGSARCPSARTGSLWHPWPGRCSTHRSKLAHSTRFRHTGRRARHTADWPAQTLVESAAPVPVQVAAPLPAPRTALVLGVGMAPVLRFVVPMLVTSLSQGPTSRQAWAPALVPFAVPAPARCHCGLRLVGRPRQGEGKGKEVCRNLLNRGEWSQHQSPASWSCLAATGWFLLTPHLLSLLNCQHCMHRQHWDQSVCTGCSSRHRCPSTGSRLDNKWIQQSHGPRTADRHRHTHQRSSWLI
mmetsp:Transcript_71349/g.209158  ORF Transcript_71349/g.209158 Transcript_71349/m.209158 type:complete len:274 (+) Transcript_71349:286-1107(+)